MSFSIQHKSYQENDIQQFIKKFENLPNDLIYKILQKALPKKNIELEKAIKLEASLFRMREMFKKWSNIRSIMTWEDQLKNSNEDLHELFNTFKNCGCCERHSTNVYYNIDNEPIPHFTGKITGSLTRKKFHNKINVNDKMCMCPCRGYMRTIIRCIPIT